MLSKKVMDQRFAEKMRAIKEGRTPVFIAESLLSSDPIAAANARIQEKVKRHFAKPAQAKAVEEAAKPEADGGEAEVDSDALAKEIAGLNKAQIAERIKADFGIEVDKDSMNKDKLVELYLEEAAKPEADG